MRSVRVVLPESMCALIPMLRSFETSRSMILVLECRSRRRDSSCAPPGPPIWRTAVGEKRLTAPHRPAYTIRVMAGRGPTARPGGLSMRPVLPVSVALALLLLTAQVVPAAQLETELKGASAPTTSAEPAVPATTEWGMLFMVLLVLTASTALFRNRGF